MKKYDIKYKDTKRVGLRGEYDYFAQKLSCVGDIHDFF